MIITAIVVGSGILVNLLFSALRIDLAACPAGTPIDSVKTVACRGRSACSWYSSRSFSGPLYYVFFWSLTGQTLGQRVMGLRVVRLNSRRLGFRLSLVRWIGYQLCIFTLGIGFLWVLIDDRRMGWHDKLARTCVVYAWPAEQNENFIAKVNRRFGRRKATSAQVEPISLQDASTAQEQIAG